MKQDSSVRTQIPSAETTGVLCCASARLCFWPHLHTNKVWEVTLGTTPSTSSKKLSLARLLPG